MVEMWSWFVNVQIWGQSVHVLQNKILKLLTHQSYRSNSAALYANLNLSSIKQIHKLFVSTFVYKQRTGRLPLIIDNYFVRNIYVWSRNTRQNEDLFVEHCHTNKGSKSLKVIVANTWDSLPQHLKDLPTLKGCSKRIGVTYWLSRFFFLLFKL